jgi:hypothetical protein
MPKDREVAKLARQADHLLRSGQFGNHTVGKTGQVGDPIPVLDSGKALYAWFVPVTIAERIAGFFMFSPDSTFLRYSSFQHHEGELDTCPLAATWIDEKTILQLADKEMFADERVVQLYLSFDGAPSRIAWAVDTEHPDGKSRTLFIAGNSIWSRS